MLMISWTNRPRNVNKLKHFWIFLFKSKSETKLIFVPLLCFRCNKYLLLLSPKFMSFFHSLYLTLHLFIVYHIDVAKLECFSKQMQSKYFEKNVFIYKISVWQSFTVVETCSINVIIYYANIIFIYEPVIFYGKHLCLIMQMWR